MAPLAALVSPCRCCSSRIPWSRSSPCTILCTRPAWLPICRTLTPRARLPDSLAPTSWATRWRVSGGGQYVRLGSTTAHSGKLPHCDDASSSNLVLHSYKWGEEGEDIPISYMRCTYTFIKSHTHILTYTYVSYTMLLISVILLSYSRELNCPCWRL